MPFALRFAEYHRKSGHVNYDLGHYSAVEDKKLLKINFFC